MCAATGYTLFFKDVEVGGVQQKGYEMILASSDNITAFVVGNIVAFVVAMLAIKFFIGLYRNATVSAYLGGTALSPVSYC